MIVAPEPPAIVQADPQSLYRAAVADRLAGRPDAAVAKLEQVLASRPDDVDARLNLGLALLALDRLAPAETAFRDVVERAPNYAEAWSGLARIAQRRGDLNAAQSLAEQARRAAPESAEIALLVGGEVRLGGTLNATLDASIARYPIGTVTGVHPGLATELADGRLRLATRWINVWDENDDYRNGWAATARWQATDRFALRLGYADAPESSDGATVEVSAWNVGTEIGLTERLVLRLDYLSEDRDAYDREAVSLGLGWRF